MNHPKREGRKSVPPEGIVSQISITTTHELEEMNRSDIWNQLSLLPIHLEDKTGRRAIGNLPNDGQKIEFQVESKDHHTPSKSPIRSSRPETADVLRIKISQPNRTGLVQEVNDCLVELEEVEKSIKWISSRSPVSITFHLDNPPYQMSYNQIQNGQISIVIFEDKVELERVDRENIERSLNYIIPYISGSTTSKK